MNLQDVYSYVMEPPRVTDTEALIAGSQTEFWRVLKKQVLEPKIIALLTLAGDMTKVLNGEETEEEYGKKAVMARATADHLQSIIYLVESNYDSSKK